MNSWKPCACHPETQAALPKVNLQLCHCLAVIRPVFLLSLKKRKKNLHFKGHILVVVNVRNMSNLAKDHFISTVYTWTHIHWSVCPLLLLWVHWCPAQTWCPSDTVSPTPSAAAIKPRRKKKKRKKKSVKRVQTILTIFNPNEVFTRGGAGM